VVICLDRGAYDLRMAQLMPLPPHHLLLHLNPGWFNLSGGGLPRFSSVVKVRGNAGKNAVPGPIKIAGERSQATHSR